MMAVFVRWENHVPCAHIAAPILFEMVNMRPTIGKPSSKAAVNPKARKYASINEHNIEPNR